MPRNVTTRTGGNLALLQGNQNIIQVPVPAQHTVNSTVMQPRPNYGAEPSPGGSALVSDVSEKAAN